VPLYLLGTDWYNTPVSATMIDSDPWERVARRAGGIFTRPTGTSIINLRGVPGLQRYR
jgi:hypothetical protein